MIEMIGILLPAPQMLEGQNIKKKMKNATQMLINHFPGGPLLIIKINIFLIF
jgi:hypothetical protein